MHFIHKYVDIYFCILNAARNSTCVLYGETVRSGSTEFNIILTQSLFSFTVGDLSARRFMVI